MTSYHLPAMLLSKAGRGLLRYPNIAIALMDHEGITGMANSPVYDNSYDSALALIGMSGRFPGAQDTTTFWRNIAAGSKSIRFFSDEELLVAGVEPALFALPNYVKAGAPL